MLIVDSIKHNELYIIVIVTVLILILINVVLPML